MADSSSSVCCATTRKLRRVGSRVRLGLTLIDAHEKNPGQWLLKARAVMEIEGSEKPAYIAETLALCVL